MGLPVELAAMRCRRGMRAAARLRMQCFGPRHKLYSELRGIESRLRELFQIALYETREEITEQQDEDLILLMRQLRSIRREVA